MNYAGKKYWIVGASEGLGRALAHQLSFAGAELVVSARSKDRLTDLVSQLPNKATAVVCDVVDEKSIAAAFKAAGKIDGMVYAAGAYFPMRAENWNADEVALMNEVNFLGATRVLAHVVPEFVQRDGGHIVLIGSLAGFRGLPGAIGYGASKAALMHLGENLYADLRKTGISVQVINPGFIKTRLTDKNDYNMPFIMSPEDAAKRTLKLMNSGRFQTSYPFWFSMLFRLGRFLPTGLFYRIFK